MTKTIRIATRTSPLALWQTERVKAKLLEKNPQLHIEFIKLLTAGDRQKDIPLTDIGGKILFVKALQNAVLENRADIAVHCIKDMSVTDCPGLCLAAILEREDPRDVLASQKHVILKDLPPGAVIGTSSPRRQSQLLHLRPDLTIKLLRGNVGTRLNKLANQQYDAIILAAAGVKRLALTDVISEYLPTTNFLPAIGQGALGMECRTDDAALCELIASLSHPSTYACVTAERAVNKVLGGDCHTPIAAHAVLSNNRLSIRAQLGSLDGKQMLHASAEGSIKAAKALGHQVGHALLDQGGKQLLDNQRIK